MQKFQVHNGVLFIWQKRNLKHFFVFMPSWMLCLLENTCDVMKISSPKVPAFLKLNIEWFDFAFLSLGGGSACYKLTKQPQHMQGANRKRKGKSSLTMGNEVNWHCSALDQARFWRLVDLMQIRLKNSCKSLLICESLVINNKAISV